VASENPTRHEKSSSVWSARNAELFLAAPWLKHRLG
jgi:hypothetical protein